jgi:hypothetical protein
MKASSLSHHLASAARSDRGHSFILLKDDGDQGRSSAERRLLPDGRQTGSNPSREQSSQLAINRHSTH